MNAGAMDGPLTIRGHLLDASGNAIVGGRVSLDGDLSAVRFSDIAGGFSFHVHAGRYSLSSSGECTLSPSRVAVDVHADVTQNFMATGSGCATSLKTNVIGSGAVFSLIQGGNALGTTFAHVEQRSSSTDAVARLQQIVHEQATAARSLTIDGNPAVERQAVVPIGNVDPDLGGDAYPTPTSITTAVAIGSTVVRFESLVPSGSTAATLTRFVAGARNFTPDSIADLHGSAPLPVPTFQHIPTTTPPSVPDTPATGVLPAGQGEFQIAASNYANAVVYGTQNGPFVSFDGGQTIRASVLNTVPAPPAKTFTSNGDPTISVGAPNTLGNQTFYYAQLAQSSSTKVGTNIDAVALFTSTDNGTTFNPAANPFPINCAIGSANCQLPDQEQLVADSRNQTAAGDQLYLAWRNFTSTTGETIALACSADGGATWTTDYVTGAITGGDFPRMAVGPDGSLLVAHAIAPSSGNTSIIAVQRFSSCANGFQPQFYDPLETSPVDAYPSYAAFANSISETAGLDRLPQGNYVPSFDDVDSSSQKVFLVYANEATAGNDDIHVSESINGGANWTSDVIVNTLSAGHRFLPWMCSTVGKHFVTWYDRRNGTAAGATSDLTAYYRSSVSDNGAGVLSVGTEFDVTGAGKDDPQCATGFPNQARNALEETQCTNLPAGVIPAGTCRSTCPTGTAGPCGSQQACDFRAVQAAANPCPNPGEVCTPGRGSPKYGDYNGAACALGTLFMAWASATSPTAALCSANGLACSAASNCCSSNCVSGVCAPTPGACTANGGTCATSNACCSGSCEGGVCLPAISMYTSTTACLGPVCSSPPPPPPPDGGTGGGPVFGITASLSGTSTGPNICVAGNGFTPNGEVSVYYFNVPGYNDGTSGAIGFASATGSVSLSDSGQEGRVVPACTSSQTSGNVIVQATDLATGNVTTTTLPSSFWCPLTLGGAYNGGCP